MVAIKYRKEFIIPYYDSDKNGTVFPTSLLAYMGETSSFHSDFLGVGINELRKRNYGWMLNRWKVIFHRYPKVKEKIIVETWTSGFDKFYATREFVIFDENNKIVGQATTLWIFLDIIRKRPIRIPKEFNDIYDILDEKLLHNFYDFNQDFIEDKKLIFNVRKSDIDYNNHVNNVKYLNWMLEVVPDNIEDDYLLSEFDILYKKEVTYGNQIQSLLSKEIGEEYKEFIHRINGDEEVSCLGRTVWNKKQKII